MQVWKTTSLQWVEKSSLSCGDHVIMSRLNTLPETARQALNPARVSACAAALFARVIFALRRYVHVSVSRGIAIYTCNFLRVTMGNLMLMIRWWWCHVTPWGGHVTVHRMCVSLCCGLRQDYPKHPGDISPSSFQNGDLNRVIWFLDNVVTVIWSDINGM